MFRADGDGERQSDRRPERIAPADPVPKPEDAIRRDAEFGDLVEPRRNSGEMPRDGGFAESVDDARAGARGVGHRLLRRERLGGDDKQRACEIERGERLREIGAIDIGDEMRAWSFAAIGRERAAGHRGTQVRAADADIDDVGETLALRGLCRARADGARKVQHLLALAFDLTPYVDAADADGLAGEIAQRHVHGGPALRVVDGFTGKQCVTPRLDMARACERNEQLDGLARNLVPREVEEEAVDLDGEFLGAPGVAREEVAGAKRFESAGVGLQSGEGFVKAHVGWPRQVLIW